MISFSLIPASKCTPLHPTPRPYLQKILPRAPPFLSQTSRPLIMRIGRNQRKLTALTTVSRDFN